MKQKIALGTVILTLSAAAMANFTASGNDHNKPAAGAAEYSPVDVTKSTAADRPMRILLTNDDGCRSPGIVTLKEKLEAKGYDVWLSAPADNQSGIGTAITFKLGKEFPIERISPRHYCFPGTPSDALDFGLVGLLRGNEPDLVISGVNDGPNTGMAQVNSGTVGAAIRAIRHGYPAIAASIGIIPDEVSKGFPSTKQYWPDSIDYVVNMVDTLSAQWTAGKDVLPKGSGLSINYPPIAKDQINGVKYVGNEFNPGAQFYYEILPNGNTKQVLSPHILKKSEADTDTGWLDRGYITYTVLGADWNGPQYVSTYESLLGDKVNVK